MCTARVSSDGTPSVDKVDLGFVLDTKWKDSDHPLFSMEYEKRLSEFDFSHPGWRSKGLA